MPVPRKLSTSADDEITLVSMRPMSSVAVISPSVIFASVSSKVSCKLNLGRG